MKLNRREVLKGGLSSLGKEAWDKVYGSDPLREENYVKVIGTPEFPKGAKLEVCLDRINKIDRIEAASPEQKDENPVNPVNPVKKESVLRIKIPKADGNPDSRVAVRPCSSLGTKGKALGATWRG